jgi:hypothetical protein
MPPHRYLIRFDGLAAAEAGTAAGELRRTLQDLLPGIDASLVRTDPAAMDFGTVLEVVVGTRAVAELAKGVANWLARSPASKVTIIGPNGKTIVEGITARQAVGLAEKLHAAGSAG